MAGVNEAGLNGSGKAFAAESGGGLLSPLARTQYAALARLRWHMFTNSLRSNKGVFELGARTLALIFYTSMGLGLGAGMGAGAYALASRGWWSIFPVLLWMTFLLWQVVPLVAASLNEQFDMGILLRFPMSFGSYFLAYTVFGLVDLSTIRGTLCCLGIWAGITMVRPELLAWAALGLGAFAVFNILLARAIFAWIDRWLAQRKTREILGGVFLALMLSMQLVNPALYQQRHEWPKSPAQKAEGYRNAQAQWEPWLKPLNAVQQWLPPGLAAVMAQQAAERQPEEALGSLGMLGLYALAAWGALAGRLRREYRGENLGAAPSREAPAASREKADRGGWLVNGSGPIAAGMEKELHCLLRTLPLLYALGAPLLLVLVFASVFSKNAPDAHMFRMALPICMVYAQVGFTPLFYNNLGTEGAGIQLYFLTSTPIRTVMLAKNLFHALLFGLVLLLTGIVVAFRLSLPDGVVMAATVAWLLFALPSNLAAGNILSINLPYRVNPGRIARPRGSQANALLSLLVQTAVLGVGTAVFVPCLMVGRLWLAVPVFLVLAGAAVMAWMRVLREADAMANRRRESLLAILMKTE